MSAPPDAAAGAGPARPGALSVELSLLRHALEAVVDEMALALMRTAYSPNMKSSLDLATGLCDADGELIAQSLTLPVHLGAIPNAVAAVRRTYPPPHRPGDVFLLNDPYDGGTHLPDFFVLAPVFWPAPAAAPAAAPAGGEAPLAGYVVTVAHYTDVGGRVAGGNASDSTELYQEGLRLPPLKLVDAGTAQEGLFRLIERNVRVPRMVLGDLRAQLAACHTGVRETGALLHGRYGGGEGGLAAFRAETAALVDYAERFARAELRALPAGTYVFEDALDGDGIDPDPVVLRVALTVSGDRLVADFTGSAPQVRGAINCPVPFTRSVVYACVRCLLSRDLPNNGGYFRAIEVIAPEGTIVNPLPPAPVAARGLTGFRIANTVFGALARLAPERVPACESGGDTGISLGGYDAQRRPFVYLEFLHGSWGGRSGRDGVDASASVTVNFSNTPVELVEASYPLRVERYGFVPDSGGAGAWRGGLGLVKDLRFLEAEATLQVRADRQRFRPYGLSGGEGGAPGANLFAAADGAPREEGAAPDGSLSESDGVPWERLPAKTLLTVRRGDRFRHVLPGAGGWGPPLARDPALVLEDVRQEKVTPAAALERYGVALSRGADGAWEVDAAATARRRGAG